MLKKKKIKSKIWSQKKKKIISDLDIKIVNIFDTTQIQTVKGHTRHVRDVQFDPKGKYLVFFFYYIIIQI